MAKERFKMTPAVFLVLTDGKKVLLLKRKDTGHEDGNYGLPSGHVDGKETLIQAICREASEEIGITLNPESIRFVNTMHRLSKDKKEERLDFFFMSSRYDGKIENKEPHKCDELSFFDLDSLPENTIDYIRKVIENIRKKEPYTEFGWD